MTHREPHSRVVEDLWANLAQVSAIAKQRCNGCADYHVRYVASRALSERFAASTDRGAIAGVVAREVSNRGDGPLAVLVAGAADTGLLATAALGVEAAGALERTTFTVIDRCDTPLELCRRFGANNGIEVATDVVDVTRPGPALAADVICIHSLFRFIAQEQHVAVVNRIASWLKPRGRIVFSMRIVPPGSEFLKRRMRNWAVAEVEQKLSEREIALSEPVDDFVQRLKSGNIWGTRAFEAESIEELERLFEACSLTIVERIDVPMSVSLGKSPRVVFVLERPKGHGA